MRGHSHPRPTERSFGMTVGTAAMAFGAWIAWRGNPPSGWSLFGVGVLLLAAGVTVPAALRLPNRLWWQLAGVLGWINTRVLLTAFFVLVLVPVGITMRLFGRNPLRASGPHSTWQPIPAHRRDPRHYSRMF